MPEHYTLDQGETEVSKIHRHWIDLVSLGTMAGIMLIIALVIAYGYGRYSDQFPQFPGAGLSATVLVTLFIAIGALILLVGLWVYRRNYVLVTDRHIIQVEQRGLFDSQVDQVSIGRIQDVSGQRSGILGTLLNYGTVIVQSAGEQRQFIFTHVPNPQPLSDYLLELHEQFLKTHQPGE